MECTRRTSGRKRARDKREFKITLSSDEDVSVLRLKIYQESDIDPYRQVLYNSDGLELKDNKKLLCTYNISSDSCIYLVLRSNSSENYTDADIWNHYYGSSEVEVGFGGTFLTTSASTNKVEGTELKEPNNLVSNTGEDDHVTTEKENKEEALSSIVDGSTKEIETFEADLRKAISLSLVDS